MVVAFFHSHQIVQSFSIRIFRFFKINSAPRNKKFSASPSIFYVNSFFRAVKKTHLGNKAIWPRKKGCGGDVVVVHGKSLKINIYFYCFLYKKQSLILHCSYDIFHMCLIYNHFFWKSRHHTNMILLLF